VSRNGRIYRKTTIFLLLAHIVTYIIYYFSSYLFTDSDILGYTYIFVNKTVYLLAPLVIAMIMLTGSAFDGRRRALRAMILPSLTRLVYSIPYFALKFISDGMGTGIGILFGALLSVFEAAAFYSLSFLFSFIMSRVICRSKDTDLGTMLSTPTALDFYEPVSRAIATVSAISALYFVITEIIDTVSFVVNYGSFRTGEIIYATISYLFDVSLFFIAYFTLSYIKNRVTAAFNADDASN